MLGDNKNLTDPGRNTPTSYERDTQNMSVILSYTKTNKLITALYMVTDIIDKEEPVRNKLRTLGAGIISDIHSNPIDACSKIYEILSFLDIAFAVNIISEMNCNILRKEFTALNESIKESTGKAVTLNRKVNLSEFLREELPSPEQSISRNRFQFIGQSIGHEDLYKGHARTRIGVQKGSTLMQALSDKTHLMSNNNSAHTSSEDRQNRLEEGYANQFDILKKQRRNNVINIIKLIGGSATIKDIRDKIQASPEQAGLLVSCSEKTLQRELMSMIKDGVLNKTGEKRWSRYFLAAGN